MFERHNELHQAAANPHSSALVIVKFLLQNKKIDVNQRHTENGNLAVCFAAQSGNLATLRFLIEEAGAKLHFSNNEYNLFDWAVYNTPDIMTYLTNLKSEIFTKFHDGTTPVLALAAAGKLDALRKAFNGKPCLINQTDNKDRGIFYWLELRRKSVDLNKVTLFDDAFYLITPHDKDNLIRDAVNGAIQHLNLFDLSTDQKIKTLKRIIQYLSVLSYKADNDFRFLAKYKNELSFFYWSQRGLSPHQWRFSFKQAISVLDSAIIDFSQPKVKFKTDIVDQANCALSLNCIKDSYALYQEANLWGYELDEHSCNKNSFFHAFSQQLEKINCSFRSAHYFFYEKSALDHLKKNESYYKRLIGQTPCEYLQKLKLDKFKDAAMVLAFSRAFNVNIFIIRTNGRTPILMKQEGKVNTICLAYDSSGQFHSLDKAAELVAYKSTQDLFDLTETDDYRPLVARKRKCAELNLNEDELLSSKKMMKVS